MSSHNYDHDEHYEYNEHDDEYHDDEHYEYHDDEHDEYHDNISTVLCRLFRLLRRTGVLHDGAEYWVGAGLSIP
jgi:hypothetical protein